jgi:hypothetical protein
MVEFESTGGHQNAVLAGSRVEAVRKKGFRPMGVRSGNGVSVLGKEKALSIMVT